MDLTPGNYVIGHYDGGHYDDGEIIVNEGDNLVIAFYDFTADEQWETRLFIVPKDKLDRENEETNPHFHLEDATLANVVPVDDDRAAFTRVTDKKAGE